MLVAAHGTDEGEMIKIPPSANYFVGMQPRTEKEAWHHKDKDNEIGWGTVQPKKLDLISLLLLLLLVFLVLLLRVFLRLLTTRRI